MLAKHEKINIINQKEEEIGKEEKMSDIALANMRVEENLNLVHHIIWDKFISNTKSQDGRFEYDDLFQVGSVGLVKAARTYDENGSKFSTYAASCIKNEILNYISLETTQVRNKDPMTEEVMHKAFDADESLGEIENSLYISELFEILEKRNARNLSVKKSIVMLMYQGYKIPEVAKMLKIPERKVRGYARSLAKEASRLKEFRK